MAFPSFEGAERRAAPLRLRWLPDEHLARHAERGSERAREEIDRRYRGDLYRFCLAMLGNPKDAETALAETLVKVRRGLDEGGRRIRLKPWLYRVARSETMDALCGPRLGTTALEAGQDRLLADLERLPQRERAVFVMRELSGLGFVEIGAAFGISAETAEQDHHSARARLGRLDRKRGLDLAVLPPLPIAAGSGSGLAGTVAAWGGNAVGASVVAKATATVAVVAVAGLSVQERVDRSTPAPGGDVHAVIPSSVGSESAPQPVASATVSAIAPRQDVPAASALPTPTAYVHQSEPRKTAVSPTSERAGRPDHGTVDLATATVPEPPADHYGQPIALPHDTAEVPFEETAYEEPLEAVVSEANEDGSDPEAAAPPASLEELPSGQPQPPSLSPSPDPEPPATSPSPPSAERSWGRRGGSRGRGSRRRW